MLELKPPFELKSYKQGIKKIFLGGSIEMGKAEHWQSKIVDAFSDSDVIFFNPRRDDWDSTWKQDPKEGTKFHEQVTWELDHIDMSDIVVIYFDPKTQAPISLMELGLALISKKDVLVCCPDGYFRKGNVVITAKRHGKEVINTFDELVRQLKAKLDKNISEASMPPVEDRGRMAVVGLPAKIKRLGGEHRGKSPYSRKGTFHLKGKEVGHVAHGRYFVDKDLAVKHGWPELTNAHMDM